MKKTSYIIIGLFILAVTSCQKEVIAPLSHTDASKVEWISTDSSNTNTSDERSNGSEKSSSNGSSNPGEVTVGNSGLNFSGGSEITDPNNDPDANKKKGKI